MASEPPLSPLGELLLDLLRPEDAPLGYYKPRHAAPDAPGFLDEEKAGFMEFQPADSEGAAGGEDINDVALAQEKTGKKQSKQSHGALFGPVSSNFTPPDEEELEDQFDLPHFPFFKPPCGR